MTDADTDQFLSQEEALRAERVNQLRVPGQLLSLVELLFRKGILTAADLRRWEDGGDEFANLLLRSYDQDDLIRIEALIEIARRLGAGDEDLAELTRAREQLFRS